MWVLWNTQKNEEGKAVRQRLEVDFACNFGSCRYYIQSAFAIPDQEKWSRSKIHWFALTILSKNYRSEGQNQAVAQ